MQYNEKQVFAIDRIVEFCTAPKTPGAPIGITLIGAGGTGKTTCIMDAVSQMLQQGFKVLLTAPTNKAVKQLSKAATAYGLDMNQVGLRTVHGAMGLTMLPNEDRKITHRAGEGVLANYDVIVVDEASMISRVMLRNYLLPELEYLGTRMVLMGDDMQLPPVRETVSECFTLFETIRLERVERFDENGGIGDFTNALRESMLNSKPFKAPDEYGHGIETILPAKFTQVLKEHFVSGVDPDESRVLAWSNKRVNEINRIIRENIYGKRPDRFYKGERVVTGSPVKIGNDVVLGTDEECTVIDYRVSVAEEEATGVEYKVYQVILEPVFVTPAKRVIVNVVHEDDEDRIEEELARRGRLARNAPSDLARGYWSRFWQLKELCADIRYCHCITVHRSQGSTFKNVFVDVKDILRNKVRTERQRLLYVAASRPSETLLLNKAKYTA